MHIVEKDFFPRLTEVVLWKLRLLNNAEHYNLITPH